MFCSGGPVVFHRPASFLKKGLSVGIGHEGEMVLDRKIAYVNLSDGSYEVKKIPRNGGRTSWAEGGSTCISSPSLMHPSRILFHRITLSFSEPASSPGFRGRIQDEHHLPLPESGHLGDSNMGGEFGAELVKAGLSHLVITGKSKKPVYLFIKDGKIKVCDARKLKGVDTIETQKANSCSKERR